jgi:hypothetical protein
MGNLSMRSFALIGGVTLLLSGCIGSDLEYSLRAPLSKSLGADLTGTFVTTDSEQVDLADASGRSTVLIFAQETCSVCIHETQEIRKNLILNETAPSQVRLFTILAGADLKIAQEWKSDHQVPWVVGMDPELELFLNYCPERKTPCVLIHRPGVGVVYEHTGAADVNRFPTITGPWY